jgi:hypothetical protein
MSVGIEGPIGVEYLADFAIARVFRLTEDANKMSANCKVCGDRLAKGDGRAAVVGALDRDVFRAYLCKGCAERVQQANVRIAERIRGTSPHRG